MSVTEKIQPDITRLEQLLDSMEDIPEGQSSDYTMKEQPIESIAELKARLANLKNQYSEFCKCSSDQQRYHELLGEITGECASIEYAVDFHINRGQLVRILEKEKNNIIEQANEVKQQSGTDLTNGLRILDSRFKKLREWISSSKFGINTEDAETAIAQVILKDLREQYRGKQNFEGLNIDELYAPRMLSVIHATAKSISETEKGNKKALAQAIDYKISSAIVSDNDFNNEDVLGLVCNIQLLKMYFALYGDGREAGATLEEYYQKPDAPERLRTNPKNDTNIPKRSSAELYTDMAGIERPQEKIDSPEEYHKYREDKIKYWQSQCIGSIRPKDGYVSIIYKPAFPVLGKKRLVKKCPKDKVYVFLDKFRGKEIDALIFGNGIVRIGPVSPCGLENIFIKVGDCIFPEDLEVIKNDAFRCLDCQNMTFPPSLRTINDSAFTRSTLGRVVFPQNLDSIGDAAFYHAKITSIILPKNLKHIGCSAFASVNLQSIIIPENVKTVGTMAFGWTSIKEIMLKGFPQIIDERGGTFGTLNEDTVDLVCGSNDDVKLIMPDKKAIDHSSVADASLGPLLDDASLDSTRRELAGNSLETSRTNTANAERAE